MLCMKNKVKIKNGEFEILKSNDKKRNWEKAIKRFSNSLVQVEGPSNGKAPVAKWL